ncbi:MAG: hypothetical protein IKP53_08485 [Candidatus Methanomethylophilaceae archaeon]|nr:hypothetical protein [Candidatus Methanomethylophilaceae archaeon]
MTQSCIDREVYLRMLRSGAEIDLSGTWLLRRRGLPVAIVYAGEAVWDEAEGAHVLRAIVEWKGEEPREESVRPASLVEEDMVRVVSVYRAPKWIAVTLDGGGTVLFDAPPAPLLSAVLDLKKAQGKRLSFRGDDF